MQKSSTLAPSNKHHFDQIKPTTFGLHLLLNFDQCPAQTGLRTLTCETVRLPSTSSTFVKPTMSGPSGMSGPPPAVFHEPGFHLYADQGDKILGTMIALIVLASTFVILRLTSRHLARAGFWVSETVSPATKEESLTRSDCMIVGRCLDGHSIGTLETMFSKEAPCLLISSYSFLP